MHLLLTMKVQHFHLQTSILLGITLMFSLTQSFQDYIAKPYFEEHEFLVESEFSNFLDNEIQLSSCSSLPDKHNNEPKILALHRNIIGVGSHRHLVTSLTLEAEPLGPSYEVIVVERLPSGVFSDPFELQRLVRHGVFKDAAVFGDTNLELPSFQSNRSVVEVHVEITPDVYLSDKLLLKLKIELPLHARYQPLGDGFSTVEFGQPDVLLFNRIEENLLKHNCVVVPGGYQGANSRAGPIIWEVPCGNEEHEKMVSVVTFGSAVMSTLLIIFASFSYSNPSISSHLKQY